MVNAIPILSMVEQTCLAFPALVPDFTFVELLLDLHTLRQLRALSFVLEKKTNKIYALFLKRHSECRVTYLNKLRTWEQNYFVVLDRVQKMWCVPYLNRTFRWTTNGENVYSYFPSRTVVQNSFLLGMKLAYLIYRRICPTPTHKIPSIISPLSKSHHVYAPSIWQKRQGRCRTSHAWICTNVCCEKNVRVNRSRADRHKQTLHRVSGKHLLLTV